MHKKKKKKRGIFTKREHPNEDFLFFIVIIIISLDQFACTSKAIVLLPRSFPFQLRFEIELIDVHER